MKLKVLRKIKQIILIMNKYKNEIHIIHEGPPYQNGDYIWGANT